MDVLKFKDFAEVVVDGIEALPKGSRLFIAGSQPVPEDENDPYNLRVKFIVCPVQDSHIVNYKFYMIDPRSVIAVSTEEQEKLTAIMEEDFKKDESPN